MSDFDFEGLFVEPRPDEDAWEAYLDLALDRIGGDRSDGLTNRQIAELESVIGCQLPFEVGLMLVMGVPTAEPWRQWQDPHADFRAWNDYVLGGLCFDVEHNNFWPDSWGARPALVADQLARATELFWSDVPPLFPIYGHRAVPLVAAEGQPNSDGNPVLSVVHSDVVVYGDDLAAWMHREFDVPLPMWPSEQRSFDFWSECL